MVVIEFIKVQFDHKTLAIPYEWNILTATAIRVCLVLFSFLVFKSETKLKLNDKVKYKNWKIRFFRWSKLAYTEKWKPNLFMLEFADKL